MEAVWAHKEDLEAWKSELFKLRRLESPRFTLGRMVKGYLLFLHLRRMHFVSYYVDAFT